MNNLPPNAEGQDVRRPGFRPSTGRATRKQRHNRESEDFFQELFRKCESCLHKLKEELPERAGVKIAPLPRETEQLFLPSEEQNLADGLREPMTKLFSFSELMRDASGKRDFDASGLGLMMGDLYREFEAVIRCHDPAFGIPATSFNEGGMIKSN